MNAFHQEIMYACMTTIFDNGGPNIIMSTLMLRRMYVNIPFYYIV